MHTHTHTHTQLFNDHLFRTLFTYSLPSWYQTSSVNFFHLLWSVVSSLFNLHAWRSFFTAFLKVPFCLPLGLGPSASYVIHFFTQLSSSHNTCPYHCNLLVMSSILNLSLNSLVQNLSFALMLCIRLTILISARWSATSFSFLTGQVLLHCVLLAAILHAVCILGHFC